MQIERIGRPAFTALVSGNDHMALGAMTALRTAGFRVPEDISVVGFDNTDEAANAMPALSTVDQSFEDVASRALDLVRAVVGNGSTGAGALLEPHIIVRSSTSTSTAAAAATQYVDAQRANRGGAVETGADGRKRTQSCGQGFGTAG